MIPLFLSSTETAAQSEQLPGLNLVSGIRESKGNESTMANGKRSFSCLSAAVLLLAACLPNSAWAQTAPPMGTARSFAVLGASTVTNTGPTSVIGDVGVSPGSAITGFPPGVVTGSFHAADAVAGQAQSDAVTAYNSLVAEACPLANNLTGQDLGGLTLLPGVYCFNTSAQLTGTLTLDAAGDPNAIFVFQIGSTLITASNSAVIVGGGSPCNVFFQVGSSATLGTGTQFAGNIFALISVTANTGASVQAALPLRSMVAGRPSRLSWTPSTPSFRAPAFFRSAKSRERASRWGRPSPSALREPRLRSWRDPRREALVARQWSCRQAPRLLRRPLRRVPC
jgi:Ice-binding-like